MENNIISASTPKNEHDIQKLMLEQALKQTELLEKQTKLIKNQTFIVSAIMIVVAIALLALSVQLGGVLEDVNSAISEITVLTKELNAVLEESDITGLLNNANTLIGESGDALTKALEGVDDALDTIGQIDIETLNSAISDLQKVVEPLAKLFGR